MPGDSDRTEEVLEVSSRLDSTSSSIQSYRAELINESLEQTRLLSGDDFSEKSSLLLDHLRSQQRLSLKAIEEVYQRQVRRNTTTDKMLSAMERLVFLIFLSFWTVLWISVI